MLRRLARFAVIAVIPLTLAITSVPASANPAAATIHVFEQAQLLTSLDVDLTVAYSCDPALQPGVTSIAGLLRQAPSTISPAFVFPLTCDGTKQQVVVTFVGPFSAGDAVAEVGIGFFGCTSLPIVCDAFEAVQVNVRA